jgi:hypothetical protein
MEAELEDVVRAPRIVLADVPEDSGIKKSDNFCSRIIQQHTRQSDRYLRCMTFLRILKYSFPERTEFAPPFPRPLRSPFPCWQCHRKFSGPPVFLPMSTLEGVRDEYGNFCSGPCANTYLHMNMHSVDQSARAADLIYYLQEEYGFRGTHVGLAPHFTEHVNYGGDLTDEAFCRNIAEPTVTDHIRMRPFIPTDAVIEVVAPRGDVLEGVLGVPLPSSVSERQQHKWEFRNIQQPPLADIEVRLASLEKPEKRQGLYELYLERKGGFAPTDKSPDTSEVNNVAVPKKPAQKRKAPAALAAPAPVAESQQAGDNTGGGGSAPAPPPPQPASAGGLAGLLVSASLTTKGKKAAGPLAAPKSKAAAAPKPSADPSADSDLAASTAAPAPPPPAAPARKRTKKTQT